MKISPTMGSLFDGSGGFPLGGLLHGIEPIWASEVEPYTIAVTKLHFPNMKHLGDVSKIHGGEIAPVDVVTFGSPCQDMSIAGKRAGLLHTAKGDDTTTRSGLFYEAIRIMKEMREATHGKYPSFAVWENVPGALTSAKGEDFRCVLQELLQIAEGRELSVPQPANGKWLHAGEILADHSSIAWRILDAQYWGVPQRRKRIYLVADFGGQRAGEILFEREGVRGYFAQGGTQRKGATSDPQRGSAPDDREGEQGSTVVAYSFDSLASNSMKSSNPNSGCRKVEIAKTLDTTDPNPCKNQGGIAVVEAVPYTLKIRSGCEGGTPWQGTAAHPQRGSGGSCHAVYPEIARTLAARHDSSPCIDRGQNVVALDCRNLIGNQEISGTLQAKNEGGYSLNFINPVVYDCRGNGDVCTVPNLTGDHENRVTDYTAVCVGNGQLHQTDLGDKTGALNCMHDQQAIIHKAKPPRKYIVRRLTPLECARLQGFPDWWGHPDHKDSFTEEELAFWQGVRDVYASINGKQVKTYTAKQMLKWYNGLHTDSAEYKMWGNGVAEPCVCFVMDGIARAMAEQWAGPCANRKE